MKSESPVKLQKPMSIWIAGSVDECIADADTGLVDAIVTNPTVLANWCAGGATLERCVNRLLEKTSLPIFIQTRAGETAPMLAEAHTWVAMSSRIVPKLPSTFAGLEVTRQLAGDGIATLITTICTVRQSLALAAAGARFLCPYFSRLRDVGGDPVQLLRDASKRIADTGVDCPILPASIRTPEQIDEVMCAGAAGVIVFHKTFREMLDHEVTQKSLADFERDDWPRVQR